MTYATLDDLRHALTGGKDAAYHAKMMHPLPKAETVDRIACLVGHCTDQRVLDCGPGGALSETLRECASAYVSMGKTEADVPMDFDVIPGEDWPNWHATRIVCAELLEHLSNPGYFLDRVHRAYPTVPLLVTVPNAYNAASQQHLSHGLENVHRDHVAWYSPHTISHLLERAGYTVGHLWYYGGDGPQAEGLIVATEAA